MCKKRKTDDCKRISVLAFDEDKEVFIDANYIGKVWKKKKKSTFYTITCYKLIHKI